MSSFQPDWVSAPGSTIRELLQLKQICASDFAETIGLDDTRVSKLLEGSLAITRILAEKIAGELGSTARFWLARETSYRESLRRLQTLSAPVEYQNWIDTLPCKDMAKFGWIQATSRNDWKTACLDFFGVESLAQWKAIYEEKVNQVAFRTTSAFDINPASVLVWLKKGEMAAKKLFCAPWNAEGFEKALPRIRELTREKSPEKFFPVLQDLCAANGVAVVVARTPEGCRASGAARFLPDSTAIIQLSSRYKTDDQFWFTFFHEACHVLRHRNKNLWLEDVGSDSSKEEQEANSFAVNTLLSHQQQSKLQELPLTYKAVIRFALETRLSPGIIVGQLQHCRRANFDRLNKAKRVLEWDRYIL
jgi:HTH-type transcriptional regulator/antitoxin HigA